MKPTDVDRLLRPVPLKDLRAMARVRGLNPGGGKEQLEDRVKQHMMSTGNYSTAVPADGGEGHAQQSGVPQGYAVAPQGYQQYTTGVANNNYSRPGGQQNVGNFITDRPSSHVTAPPGGRSTVQLGSYEPPAAAAAPPPQYQQPYGAPQYGTPPPAYGGSAAQPYGAPPQQQYGAPQQQYGTPGQPAPVYGATSNDVRGGSLTNNYSRPNGQQNVGNFITDRPSSRVLAPPGGSSQISFGDYTPPPAQQQQRAPPPQQQQHYGSPGPQYGMPPQQQQQQPAYGYGPASGAPGPMGGGPSTGVANNNYSRPNGQQNVGNFITDRPSSRVLAPPGGKSQISFG